MKIHTIQLNIEDFESGTAGMDAREKGAYISLLICLYKVSSHELPDDDKRLARMACLNMREWKKVREILEPKFETYNGVWKHKRVLQEAVRYQKLSQKNTSNALKGHNSPKPLACQPHSQNGANTSNKELITNNKDKNPPKPPKGYSDDFEFFWNGWKPYKTGKGSKQDAGAEYEKAIKIRDLNELLADRDNYCQFCEATDCNTKNVFRWLRKKGWEDDYSIVTSSPKEKTCYDIRDELLAEMNGDTPCLIEAN